MLLWDTPPPPADAGRARSEQEFLELFPALLRLTFGLPGPAVPEAGTPPRSVDEAIESVRGPDWSAATIRELHTMYKIWRVCDRALAGHRPRPHGAPVQLFAAEQALPAGTLAAGIQTGDSDGGARTAEDLRRRWRRCLTADPGVTTVPGHHFSMFDAAHLPRLGAAYDQALAAASGQQSRPPAPPGRGRAPVALLFPGQGTQYAGMGRDLFARHPELVGEADQVLGYSVAEVCAGDPRRPLTDTGYAQPVIYVVGALALRSHLEENGERPVVALGHSLGEYNALEAAGVFSFADGLRLVAERGAAMARIRGGGMIAVNGLSEEEIGEILDGPGQDPASCGPVQVYLAAANAPRSHTLAGPEPDLDALTAVLLERGARSVRRLNVDGPFHSPFMSPAAREFSGVLGRPAQTQGWAPPVLPVIANTTARPHVPGEVQEELVAQIDNTVLWRRSVERAVADHDPEFREISDRGVLMPLISQVRAAP